MTHELDLIFTLSGALAAALVLGFLTQRIGLSPIVGYLFAGIAVGPFTPGFVASRPIANQLAEVGVILLMFGVGLQFHLKELLAVRKVAIPGALAQIAVATALGVAVAAAFGWSTSAGLVFGLAISVASTVVLTRVLSDHRALHTPIGHIAVGWLVVEDLFTVLVLVLLPALFGSGARLGPAELSLAVGGALGKLAILVVFTFVVGRRLIPAVLGFVAQTRSRELFTLTVLVIALALAVGSAEVFGASMALGAFLAGMVVGQSEFSSRAAAEALPLRDAFAVLFFVSVGMLLDPADLWNGMGLAAATLAVVLVGKPLAAAIVVLLLGYPLKVALAVSVALAQIGEFSFIVASLGRELGVLPVAASQALVVASIVSVTLNPLLYRAVEPLARRLAARSGAREAAAEPARSARHPAEHSSVVVGYGPVGRTLARALRDNGIRPVVIELNHETVRELTRDDLAAVYGDAADREILERAEIARASSLIFTGSDAATEAAIRAARELNPDLLVLARANYSSEVASLERAGADVVCSSEGEIALAMVEHLLLRLGASRDQVDRERERIREELSISPAAESPRVNGTE